MNIDDITRDKISKVYELVKRGATDGEKDAAKKALDRILKKYNLDESCLQSLDVKEYVFTYTSKLELDLLSRIMTFFLSADVVRRSGRKMWLKQIVSKLQYTEWITIECAYEYFQRHMKKEWKKVCAPQVAKSRNTRTKNKTRQRLQESFFVTYIIKSKLVNESEIVTVSVDEMSRQEIKDRMLMQNIQGGMYKQQVSNTKLLNN